MPPLPVIPNTLQFTTHMQLSGGPIALNRFFMKYTGAVGGTDATTMLSTLVTSWGTRIAPQVSTTNTLVQVSCLDLGSKTGVNVFVPASHAGGAASPSLAAGVAVVISAKISFRYRGGHPRVYLAGIGNVCLQDTNTLTTAFQGSIFTAWTGMLSDLTASPPPAVGAISEVSVHAYSSNPVNFPGGVPTTKPPWPLASPQTYPITSWAVNPQVGSQRRRNQQP